MQPTLVFLPREFHGQRTPVDYSPWDCKQLDTTERLTQHNIHTHTHTPSVFSLPLIPTLYPTLLGHNRTAAWAPCTRQQLGTSSLFHACGVYMSMLPPQFLPLSPPAVFTGLFSSSVSSFFPLKTGSSVLKKFFFLDSTLKC